MPTRRPHAPGRLPILLLLIALLQPWPTLAGGRIPVILDTDIGFDIDDTWALAMLAKRRELDVRLVLGSHGKHLYRARLIAKILDQVDRSDIPVGVGPDQGRGQHGRQSGWLGDYRLEQYPGRVHRDGIQAMIDTLMAADDPVTLIVIGPLTNLAIALQREPRIADKAKVIAVAGSIRRGMFDRPRAAREYNISVDIAAARAVLSARWPVTLAPWDTTGNILLVGKDYEKVLQSGQVASETVIANYRSWLKPNQKRLAEQRSTLLFDTLAIYLATLSDSDQGALVEFEDLPVRVTERGMTRVDRNAKTLRVATDWKDKREFNRYIRDTLTRKSGLFQGGLFGFDDSRALPRPITAADKPMLD